MIFLDAMLLATYYHSPYSYEELITTEMRVSLKYSICAQLHLGWNQGRAAVATIIKSEESF